MAKWLLGIALFVGSLSAGCGDVDVPDHPDPLDHRGDAETPATRETAGAPEELLLQTNDLKFAPAEVRTRAGATTELTLENLDDVEHDFQIDAIDVDVVEGEDEPAEHDGGHAGDLSVHADSGETDSVTFVVNEPGTYGFYCTVSGHKDAGMIGTLIVQ